MLNACRGVDRVGSFVIGIDDVARSAAGDAAGIAGIDACAGRRVDGLEGGHPAVLGEIVVEETEAGADDGGSGLAGRIGDADPGPEGFAVIVGHAVDERNVQGLQRQVGGIDQLELRPEAVSRPNVVS